MYGDTFHAFSREATNRRTSPYSALLNPAHDDDDNDDDDVAAVESSHYQRERERAKMK